MDVFHHSLVRQFDAATNDLAVLHDTLHGDVLPQLQLELALTDPDIKWLSEWLSDTGTSSESDSSTFERPPPSFGLSHSQGE